MVLNSVSRNMLRRTPPALRYAFQHALVCCSSGIFPDPPVTSVKNVGQLLFASSKFSNQPRGIRSLHTFPAPYQRGNSTRPRLGSKTSELIEQIIFGSQPFTTPAECDPNQALAQGLVALNPEDIQQLLQSLVDCPPDSPKELQPKVIAQQLLHYISLEYPLDFWEIIAKRVHWYEPYHDVFDVDAYKQHFRMFWFPGGKVNVTYDAIDRHVEQGHGNRIAFAWDSPVTGLKRTITYEALLEQVSKFAGGLANLGLKAGDCALIFMPPMLETLVSMLACARLGIVHSLVFGGFGRNELATRIKMSGPKVVIVASCGVEPRKVVSYSESLEGALPLTDTVPEHIILLQRPQGPGTIVTKNTFSSPKQWDWNEILESGRPHAPVPVPSNHPLYVIYTSGTSGPPKGVVRDHVGQIISGKLAFPMVYDIHNGETFFCCGDIAWVLGHSGGVYGPLLVGATSIMMEGKPVYPAADVLWRICAEYGAKSLFMTPSAVRAMREHDPHGDMASSHDLSNLNSVFIAGERTDQSVATWLSSSLTRSRQKWWKGDRSKDDIECLILDNWWQSETGWPVSAFCQGLPGPTPPIKPGSCGLLVPGWDVRVLQSNEEPAPVGTPGHVEVKVPLPPGGLTELWNDDAKGSLIKKCYLSRFVDANKSRQGAESKVSDGSSLGSDAEPADLPLYFDSGDYGSMDSEGHLSIEGRADDVIKVAAHRLSTASIEEVLATHPAVNEAVVFGIRDSIKGQVPVGIVMLKSSQTNKIDERELKQQLRDLIRMEIGPIACFSHCIILTKVPRTRTGKVLRRILCAMCEGEEFQVPQSIEDASILDEVHNDIRLQFNAPAR